MIQPMTLIIDPRKYQFCPILINLYFLHVISIETIRDLCKWMSIDFVERQEFYDFIKYIYRQNSKLTVNKIETKFNFKSIDTSKSSIHTSIFIV